MLVLSAALLPTRPRTAVWLATREPAISELEHALGVARRVLWPKIGWFAAGVAAGAALAAARHAPRQFRPRAVKLVFSRGHDADAPDVPAASATG